jgi:hypothetical protein
VPSSRLRAALTTPILFAALVAIAIPSLEAQSRLTTPREHFGFEIGADYRLATYSQFADYWRKLDAESGRLRLVDIGETAEGRRQLMAIVTAPENFAQLDRYREISRRLALAEGLSDDEARALAAEGKAVVWIDGGLHANEVLGAHQLLETVWQLVSRDDAETMRFLRDVIVLAVHANPDGMELVSGWYMQEPDSSRRNIAIPRLYQKYIGHDNNRDFFLSNQPETRNMNRVMYWEWFPQIVYNHHQTGPAGTVMFAPPFRDPFNYNFDPLVPVGIDLVGSAMHNRFVAENKPGVTMRSGATYSTWWNGGLRTTVYFHNMIGLLTETIGSPTPMTIPFVAEQQLPRGDMPYPIPPQRWHFRQSIDYSVTANRAVLDVASRYRETFLYNIYLMGKRSIERGSRDSWTATPAKLEEAQRLIAESRSRRAAEQGAAGGPTGQRGAPTTPAAAGSGAVGSATQPFGAGADPGIFTEAFRDPADRDPRAYVISADQRDFPTATKFVNALRYAGVTVHRATAPFAAGGRRYPAGSYVVQTAQAFRPHVLDMFEPQRHPHDFAYPGGPPRRPYDNAGWTLAYQMGIDYDRHLEPVTGPFEPLEGLARPQPGAIGGAAGAAGFLLSRAHNDAFTVVNRLLKAGETVYSLASPMQAGGRSWPSGTFYVAARPSTLPIIQGAATELGLSFTGTSTRQASDAVPVRPRRIALWDIYGGSMPSGWTRWLLEQYEFPFEVVYPEAIDNGSLRGKYDVLILPTGALGGRGGAGPDRDNIPARFRHMLGRLTEERSTPALRNFLNAGGTVVTIGSSTALAGYLGLPLTNHLVERTPSGEERPLPADRFYVPGSLLSVAVDTLAPVATGLPARVDVMFDNSPVFRLHPTAWAQGVRPVAWFDSATPLRSGWAWGQSYLEGGVTVAQARVGPGKLYLFGPEILFRGQPHGTFKLFFNSLIQ